jgi:hypothetical protein
VSPWLALVQGQKSAAAGIVCTAFTAQAADRTLVSATRGALCTKAAADIRHRIAPD